jgi:DNA topoisomerase-2
MILTEDRKSFVERNLKYTPALYKIFDEIIVNAADNYQRSKKMDMIDVKISKEKGYVSVKNNGEGIPVEIHKEHKIYVPELIFGHLLTGSNYNDEEERTTGGRNGYGAKLTNIFSKKFVIECGDRDRKK